MNSLLMENVHDEYEHQTGPRRWGRFMMEQGVFAKDEIGFGCVTDSPREAVDLIVRSLPAAVKARLQPSCAGNLQTGKPDRAPGKSRRP
jgi:hypothetical protein